jgi:hypothetical protein
LHQSRTDGATGPAGPLYIRNGPEKKRLARHDGVAPELTNGYSAGDPGLNAPVRGDVVHLAHRVSRTRGTLNGSHLHVERFGRFRFLRNSHGRLDTNRQPDDRRTGIVTNGGTILLGDSQHNSWTLGTGLLVFAGDSLVNLGTPDLAAAALITANTGFGVLGSNPRNF